MPILPIHEIAKRFPEELERVAEWEKIVSQSGKRGFATFFYQKTEFLTDQDYFEAHQVQQIVQWSKTARGGKQYALTFQQESACASAYGLCE